MKSKKFLSWLLVLAMVFSMLPGMALTASAKGTALADGYYMVGTLNGTDLWSESRLSIDRLLKDEDMWYSLTWDFKKGDEINVVEVKDEKIVANSTFSKKNYVISESQIGKNLLLFKPDGNYDWEYKYFTVIKEPVTLEINSVIAVGNGDESWLNGESWNPGAEDNMMTETQPGIWEIEYKEIFKDDNFNVKFALNGEVTGWAENFGVLGSSSIQTGTSIPAVYNGDNIIFEVPTDDSTVKLTLDVSNYDHETKTGATFTIKVMTPPKMFKGNLTTPKATVKDGYYLVGTLDGSDLWSADALTEDRLFKESQFYYELDWEFKADDEAKVAKVKDGKIAATYNAEGDAYKIVKEQEGNAKILFKPGGNSDWTYKSFSVVSESTQTIDTPLTFTAVEDNAAMSFKWYSGSNVRIKASSTAVTVGGTAVTSTDWQKYTAGEEIVLPSVGDSVSFKGSNVVTNSNNHFTIKGGMIAASGDVTSLTNGAGGKAALTENCYYGMFSGCTSLTEAPALPATTMAKGCYSGMFIGCTSLTEAPALPATTLAYGCYIQMFQNCKGLITAPELKATTLAGYCYKWMFSGCTGLTKAPTLLATKLAEYCYWGMFSGCTGLKISTAKTENEWKIPATATDATNWNKEMFKGCTGVDFGGGSKEPALNTTYYQVLSVNAWEEFQKALKATSGTNVTVKDDEKDLFTYTVDDDTVTVTLKADITAKAGCEAIAIPTGKNVTIDLNGHKIDRNLAESKDNGHVINVWGELTIKDSSNDKTGMITGGNTNQEGAGIYVNGTAAKLNLMSGTITGNKAKGVGGGVCVTPGATFNMTGGVISDNSAVQGGGVAVKYKDGSGKGKFNMTDGEIKLNQATLGGGVYLNPNTEATITGGKIHSNNAVSRAGGVYDGAALKLGGTADITGNAVGGTITSGTLTGGTKNNLYLADGIDVTFTETPAVGTAMSIGVTMQDVTDAIYTDTANYKENFSSDLLMYYPKFESNKLSLAAGAIVTTKDELKNAVASATNNTDFLVILGNDITLDSDLVIGENKEITLDLNGHTLKRDLTAGVTNGCVIYVSGKLTVTDSTAKADGKITGGNTTGEGGGIYIAPGKTLILKKGHITGNKSNLSAGGVYVGNGASFTMEGGSIDSNTAAKAGGGLYVYKGTFTMNDGAITKNDVTKLAENTSSNNGAGGGVYTDDKSTINLLGGSITENHAATFAGGIGCNGPITVGGKLIVKNNTSGSNTVDNVNLRDKRAAEKLKVAGNEGIYDVPVITVSTLESGAEIGVTLENGTGTFASGTSTDKNFFFADSGKCRVEFNSDSNALVLANAPTSSGGSSTPTITVPVTGDENTVKVQASVSGSTATVKDIKATDLAKVTGGENVEIDLSGLNKNIDTAKIPTTTVEKIAEQGGMSVKLSTATVTFDSKATETISEQAKGNTIELVVDDIKTVSLNAVQKEAVQKLDTALIIDAFLVSNGTRLCSESKGGFGGGKATVALPYEIKGNRTAANYSVYYVDDAGKLEKLNASYDAATKAFVFDIEHFSNYVVAYDENVMLFVDVAEGSFYYDAVLWATKNGITTGTDATHFNPNGSTTRAQVVTFLWRAAGCPDAEGESFADVEAGSYYEKAVAWAIAQGITKGTSETAFSPDMICTRGQIAAFLARFAGVKDADTASAFDDVKSTDYFAAAVKWAKDNKVTDGTSATAFSPDADCTRAQIVTFLYRWMVK